MLIGYFGLINISAEGTHEFCFVCIIVSIAWIVIMGLPEPKGYTAEQINRSKHEFEIKVSRIFDK